MIHVSRKIRFVLFFLFRKITVEMNGAICSPTEIWTSLFHTKGKRPRHSPKTFSRHFQDILPAPKCINGCQQNVTEPVNLSTNLHVIFLVALSPNIYLITSSLRSQVSSSCAACTRPAVIRTGNQLVSWHYDASRSKCATNVTSELDRCRGTEGIPDKATMDTMIRHLTQGPPCKCMDVDRISETAGVVLANLGIKCAT